MTFPAKSGERSLHCGADARTSERGKKSAAPVRMTVLEWGRKRDFIKHDVQWGGDLTSAGRLFHRSEQEEKVGLLRSK